MAASMDEVSGLSGWSSCHFLQGVPHCLSQSLSLVSLSSKCILLPPELANCVAMALMHRLSKQNPVVLGGIIYIFLSLASGDVSTVSP